MKASEMVVRPELVGITYHIPAAAMQYFQTAGARVVIGNIKGVMLLDREMLAKLGDLMGNPEINAQYDVMLVPKVG